MPVPTISLGPINKQHSTAEEKIKSRKRDFSLWQRQTEADESTGYRKNTEKNLPVLQGPF